MPHDGSAIAGGRRWLIGGRVQGVGFRPFVCQIAKELGISGWVRNVGGQVEVLAHGDPGILDIFLRRLLSEHPPIARPAFVSAAPCRKPAEADFRIGTSTGGTGVVLLPDQSTCESCLKELFDPKDRRFRYPFITCTQCGPRYTITAGSPFDRRRTAMAAFAPCITCQAEYDAPANRRCHAQVMACPQCGPRLSFKRQARRVAGNEAALALTVAALCEGEIIAVKGVGGYHLLCDAGSDISVARLRARKHRPTKPLAVMFPWMGIDGLAALRRCCAPNFVEAAILSGLDRPIVPIALMPAGGLSALLAPGLDRLGAFLPYSPLHYLILADFGSPLVVTSGNISGEPVLTEEADAEERLTSIADAFLHHDRPILQAADDGIVGVVTGRPRALRRGRGSAPYEVALRQPLANPVLSLGGQMKATVALGFGSRVVISPHLGDLDSPRGLDALDATTEMLQRLYGMRAEMLVCDAHDGYTSARWAQAGGISLRRVFHHHAHAGAVAGEFPHEDRWLCFTWDAGGLGVDRSLWGGEALFGRPGAWTRAATFRRFSPPGGERAARAPWRSAAALVWELDLAWSPPSIDVSLARVAWQKQLNCPATSSVGRLFDAAAALLLLVQHAGHEGEGPMSVEAIAAFGPFSADPLPLHLRPDGVWQADWAPLVPMLLDDRRATAYRSRAFHCSLASTLVAQAIAVRGTHGDFAVGLSGGVFQNRRLAELALHGLEVAGFRAYLPAAVPCNDAGLSFGQIIEFAARA